MTSNTASLGASSPLLEGEKSLRVPERTLLLSMFRCTGQAGGSPLKQLHAQLGKHDHMQHAVNIDTGYPYGAGGGWLGVTKRIL